MTLESFDQLICVRETSKGTFISSEGPETQDRMFGGQLLAQAIIAGSQRVGDERSIHSLHCYFLRPGDTSEPVEYVVDTLREGRSFSHVQMTAMQNKKPIFVMLSSWSIELEGLNFTARHMPETKSPEESPYTYRQFSHDQQADPVYDSALGSRPMDIRYINPPTSRDKQDHVEDQLMWLRITLPVSAKTSHRHAALAYLSDSTLIDHILLPHGRRWQDPDFQGTSLDHAMWFHGVSDVTQWHLFEQTVEWTGDGRGLATGRMFDLTGRLVASCAQEGLMRFDSA